VLHAVIRLKIRASLDDLGSTAIRFELKAVSIDMVGRISR
jgi:hypothetical protein